MAEPIQKNPPSSGMLGMVFSHFLFMLQTAFITHVGQKSETKHVLNTR